MTSKGSPCVCGPEKRTNTMKGLFLVYHGFSAYSGISKKIAYQCDALRHYGIDMQLCHLEIAPDGTQCRYVGEQVIRDFGRGIGAKILKRISFHDIVDYIRREGVGFVYIRHDINASPVTISLLRRIKRLGARIALEIPTYPYDAELTHARTAERLHHTIDRLFRCRMARYVDRIVTFSDEEQIFGRPTIRISNGIDFNQVRLKSERHNASHEIRLLAVANIHFWHGFDRVIEGLGAYYATPHDCMVTLRIVGDSAEMTLNDLQRRIAHHGLEEHVTLVGTRSGAALDEEFEWCNMGIASLGRHRNGITRIKTLKNREYAARGIPFVYSETDSDFDAMPYVMKAPADESAIDIAALIRFYDHIDLTPAQIRASVEENLSWKQQMACVAMQMGITNL